MSPETALTVDPPLGYRDSDLETLRIVLGPVLRVLVLAGLAGPFAFALVLLVVGVRAVERWSWPRSLVAAAFAAGSRLPPADLSRALGAAGLDVLVAAVKSVPDHEFERRDGSDLGDDRLPAGLGHNVADDARVLDQQRRQA